MRPDYANPGGNRSVAYREAFERRNLEYAIWGHISDGNLHPNVIPISLQDVEKGRDALRQELDSDQRTKFFAAYMTKARDRMKIAINADVLRTITG